MEIKIDKNNVLKFEKKLSKNETWKVSKGRKFFTISIFKKPTKVIGFANNTDSGKFIVTIDYDEIYYRLILEDFKKIQSKFNLNCGYVFTTKERKDEQKEKIGNYHLVCLSTFKMKKIYEILSETKCDYNYISLPRRNPYKNWILRLSKKGKRSGPKFIDIIGDKNINLDEEISSAHLKLLHKLYPNIPKINYLNKDGGKSVRIQEYETLN